jgi:mycothiol synthase
MEHEMNNRLPNGYTSRPARMEDLDEAVEMFNAEARHLIGVDKHIRDEVAVDWQAPGFELETDTRIVCSTEGRLVGYCQVWDLKPHVTIDCWGVVHPDHLNLGVGSYLLDWAQGRAYQAIPKAPPEARVIIKSSTITLNPAAERLFVKAGMQKVRYFFTMVIDLDGQPAEPKWPEGIDIRTLVVDRDEWPLTIAVEEAFRDHWGFVERPIEEEYERWMHFLKNNDDFDPTLYFLAWDGDQLTGASLCWKYANDDPEMGSVDVLCVRRPWRKQGLGLALLLHSFGEFRKRGKLRAGLGVDAESLTGALRLYERAGMHSDPNRTYVAYEKELRPGIELRTQEVEEALP